MKLINPHVIKPEERIYWAQLITNMLTWPKHKESSGCPYMPNEGKTDETNFWTLDSANNWKLKFYEDNQTLEIYHRYSTEEDVKCLCSWLICRFGLKEVSE